jgi:hypothetical protein
MPAIAIAKSFLPSLAQLEPREQSLTMAFVQKMMDEHVRQGTSLERVNRTKISNLWSARISQELRAILYQEGDTYLLLHVGHHDAAYAWAERRQLQHDQHNQRLQIIETVERAVEVDVHVHVLAPLFATNDDRYLLSLGLPEAWLPALREIRDHDQLLAFCADLPEEVAEALLDVATGEIVTPVPATSHPTLLHAEAGRRYYILQGQDELALALEGSLENWMLFLHPDQRQLVEGVFPGATQVVGGAGTGKTVVALHRAREMARRGASVLLATFSRALADNLRRSLVRLCSPAERARIEVSTLHSQALRLARTVRPELGPLADQDLATVVQQARELVQGAIQADVVLSEWRGVIRPGGITRWDEYRDVSRAGRGLPLRAAEKHEIWSVVARTRQLAWQTCRLDWAGICGVALRALAEGKAGNPFQAVLVDEVQDLGMAELRLIKALSHGAPGHLMLFGDTAQRIYGGRSDLNLAGLDVAGRVFPLRTNYRTTDAISRAAEAVLRGSPDGARHSRNLLRGPDPTVQVATSLEEESSWIIDQLALWTTQGLRPEEIAVLARVDSRLTALRETLAATGVKFCGLLDADEGAVRIGMLHSAKGLEFKAVAMAGCEDGTIPYRYAVASHLDPLDQEGQLEQERHLLYVGMTRAREELAIFCVGAQSRWLSSARVMS